MKRMSWCLSLWALLLPVSAQAAQTTLPFTIIGGKEDRTNVPVSVPAVLSRVLADAKAVVVQGAGEKPIPGQLTAPSLLARPAPTSGDQVARELHFIVP